MQVSVIGCGYLGAVHAACMAKLGHDVVGIDVDEAKIALLARGEAPFYEPGLPELLTESMATGRLRFSSEFADVSGADIHFICVGTPQKVGEHAADLQFVDAAVEALIPHVQSGQLVVGKSTVPVGTAEQLVEAVEAAGATLVWNPEFLREGFAISDTLHPDRLVYGVPDGAEGELAAKTLNSLYAATIAAGTPVMSVDYATAQLVKVAANSFLATKISFINAMAELCEATGADVTALADAIGHDARIGRAFLNAGLGFGGGCLPKDVRAFMARSDELGAGQTVAFLREVDSINARQREHMVALATDELGGSVTGRHISVLGLSFKPNSDDVRDSPALEVAASLHRLGAQVVVTDPKGIAGAQALHPESHRPDTVADAVHGADLVLLLTEWPEYVTLDPVTLASLTAEPRILDGRNALDPQQWRDAGWVYRSIGRP